MISHRKGILLDGIGSELVRSSLGGARKTLSKWLGDLTSAINLGDVASTFTSGDATPSVADNSKFITAGSTTITNFTGGVEGQTITIYRGTSDIGIADSATIDPIIAGTLTLSTARPSVTFRLESGVWKQVGEAGALSTAILALVQGSVQNFANLLSFTSTGSTTARSLASRFAERANVLDFGAVGDGVTNDRDAFVAAVATGKAVYVPAGYTFYYDGAGLTGANIRIIGDGYSQSVIQLGTGRYLIDDSALWGSLYVDGIRVVNGAGAIRSTYTSTMVQVKFVVRDCYFLNYTAACISHNSSDAPNFQIEGNIFQGANVTTCVGVALKGLTDGAIIRANSFRQNKVHLKLGEGGNNAYVDQNDFIRYSTGTALVDIHIVPDVDGNNAGSGLVITPLNKFGNENISAGDFRIVYADELSGTYFGDKLPDMSTNSTGYIRGHRIGGAFYGTSGTPQQPLVKSMAKRVFGSHYGNITIGGTPPTYIIQFSQTPDALTASDVHWNTIGQITCDGADDLAGFAAASSYNNIKLLADPVGSIFPQEQTIASATTTDISTAYAPTINISGSTTITGLGTAPAGVRRLLKFQGALTFTHNGTSLILPGSANITTAANDTAEMASLGSGNWICASYKRASGKPVAVAFSDLTGSLAISQMGTSSYAVGQYLLVASGVNFNSANTDTAFNISLPTGFTRYVVAAARIVGASASLTTATCGIFTAAAAGGTAIVASGSAVTVSTASENTNNNSQALTIVNANTNNWQLSTTPTIYFRVQNPQGSAATATVVLLIVPIP